MVESQVGIIPRQVLLSKLQEDLAFRSRFYQALAAFMADRLRTTVGNFCTGGFEAEAVAESLDGVAPHLTEGISPAGTRFAQMQTKVWGSAIE